MNRRTFLLRLSGGCALACSLSACRIPCSSGDADRVLKHWLWLRPLADHTNDDYKRLFAQIKAAGVDAVLPEVYNSWHARFESQRLPVEGPWLETILPLAKAEGLEVHAWMWSMICNIEDICNKHPEWFGVNGKGQSAHQHPAYIDYYKFMCPSRQEVQEFVQGTAAELAQFSEIDGIHFDYIRYPDVILAENLQPKYNIVQDREYPQYDYCYCDVCREKFHKQTGIDIMAVDDPAQNQQWRQFRYDTVTHLVNTQLVPTAHQAGKQATAAVFPNWQHVRQEWANWDVDAVMPMLYQSFYNEDMQWIKEKTAEGKSRLQQSKKLYSGLYVPDLTPEQLSKAIQVSLDGGADGITLFSCGDMKARHWEAFSRATRQ